MFMLEPPRTQFDLNWRMFGIPVRVHPFFWLTTAVLGSEAAKEGFELLLVWIACVFVSILIHELGHVFMGRVFAADGHIVLYSFGGLAIGSNQLSSRWQRVAVCFAGPFAGFVFLGVIILAFQVLAPKGVPIILDDMAWLLGMDVSGGNGFFESRLVERAVFDLVFINLLWGLLNLLPIWPLDGGQISNDVLDACWPGRGLRAALWLSVGVAGVLAVHCLMAYNGHPFLPFLEKGDLFAALFFGYLACNSYFVLSQMGPGRQPPESRHYERRAPWERDPDYWKK
jgi:Zn-dependent protease